MRPPGAAPPDAAGPLQSGPPATPRPPPPRTGSAADGAPVHTDGGEAETQGPPEAALARGRAPAPGHLALGAQWGDHPVRMTARRSTARPSPRAPCPVPGCRTSPSTPPALSSDQPSTSPAPPWPGGLRLASGLPEGHHAGGGGGEGGGCSRPRPPLPLLQSGCAWKTTPHPCSLLPVPKPQPPPGQPAWPHGPQEQPAAPKRTQPWDPEHSTALPLSQLPPATALPPPAPPTASGLRQGCPPSASCSPAHPAAPALSPAYPHLPLDTPKHTSSHTRTPTHPRNHPLSF